MRLWLRKYSLGWSRWARAASAPTAYFIRPAIFAIIHGVVRMLALETSARVGSVALFEDDRLVAHESFAHGLQNAARLLPLIDQLCKTHHLAPRDIGLVAVSIGPGSFTGLRIGVTLAKTLCYATGAKLVAVPSLQVLAANAPANARYIMPILDARRGQVFAAVYQRADSENTKAAIGNRQSAIGNFLTEHLPPELSPLADLLARAPRPLTLLGEGIAAHRDAIPADASITILGEDLWTPNAATVGRMALLLAQQGDFADPFKLTPVYMRKPEAQERMEAGLLKHLENS